MNKGSVVVIPALEPDSKLITYVKELTDSGIEKLIVIDDGSGDDYRRIFEEIGSFRECDLIIHDINMGKGRALKDAIKHYIECGYDSVYSGIITADADGQHLVEDVLKLEIRMAETGDSLILGEREFDKDVPFKSKAGNSITRQVFGLLYGIKLHDTQTGLRGIPNALLDAFSRIPGERYEYEMNMLIECSRRKINIESVIIQTVYIDDNSASHFNPFKDSVKIYRVLLGNFLKYTLSSLSATVIDIGLFKLFVTILKPQTGIYILLATVISRICSSIYNFLVNKKLVFKSDKSIVTTAVKYYILCICQMLVSAGLVTLFYSLCPIGETVQKIIVDVLLFFISYKIQQRLIFND